MIENQDIPWGMILDRIKDGKCTPFLGAGANYDIIPRSLGGDIARQLAHEFKYPQKNTDDLLRVLEYIESVKDDMHPKEGILKLIKKHIEQEDSYDLSRVAQYIVTTEDDGMRPKEAILGELKTQIKQWGKSDDLKEFFKMSNETLGVLAELPFPVYITTNYDDLLVRALEAWDKQPKRECFRWSKQLKKDESTIDSEFVPSVANPLVFHFHGYDKNPQSLVLTEDDYIDFLVNYSMYSEKLLPTIIDRVMCGTSLLFIGYALADLNFRVLFRSLRNSMDVGKMYRNIWIQLRKEEESDVSMFFEGMKMKIIYGSAKEFALELRNRWREYSNGK